MRYNNVNEYYNIALKAIKIADELGCDVSFDPYSYDNNTLIEYNYDKLKIKYHKEANVSKMITITIDETEVLKYNFLQNTIKYIEGSWKSIIEILYKQISDILYKRKTETNNLNIKIKELESLGEYMKFYIECEKDKNRKQTFDTIRYNLKDNNLSIKKIEHYSVLRNNCTGDDMYSPYYINYIYYNGKKVAEFNDNEFDLFPNIMHYVEQYIPGEWTSKFISVINYAKIMDKYFATQKVDAYTNELIEKIKKYPL